MNLASQTTVKTHGQSAAVFAVAGCFNANNGNALSAKLAQDLPSQYCRLGTDPCAEATGELAGAGMELRWEWPEETPSLASGEIHLWRAKLDQHVADLSRYSSLLSEEESARAVRFRFEKDRRQFVLRRALLRMVLSGYLETEPERLQFSYGPCGKPTLVGDGDSLQFNLSHSEGLALYAVTRDTAIGVDVERVRVIPEADQIGARYFSPQEMAAWRELPRNQQPEAFLRLWSRKEASLKLNGCGLFEIAEQIPSAQDTKALDEASVWPRFSVAHSECVLRGLTPATGYVGALALAAPKSAKR